MVDPYHYREELGNFAIEIYECPDGVRDYQSCIYRLWDDGLWSYIYQSERVFDDFSECIQDARYRMYQYFKADYINTDLGIKDTWGSKVKDEHDF